MIVNLYDEEIMIVNHFCIDGSHIASSTAMFYDKRKVHVSIPVRAAHNSHSQPLGRFSTLREQKRERECQKMLLYKSRLLSIREITISPFRYVRADVIQISPKW